MRVVSLFHFLAVLLAMGAAAGTARAQEYVYVVRTGDTLIGIGARWLADPGKWTALVRPNRISNPDYIVPGRPLRIPLALLKSEREQATVVQVTGSVEADAKRALKSGDRIDAGAELRTGADGYVTLELADGSRLVLPAQSALRVVELKRYANTGLHVSRLRLLAGRIEALVKKRDASAGRFEVDTPTAAIGVRGTDFRAGVGASGGTLRAEVLEGTVALKSTVPASAADVAVEAGFGAVADETGRVCACCVAVRAQRGRFAAIAGPAARTFPCCSHGGRCRTPGADRAQFAAVRGVARAGFCGHRIARGRSGRRRIFSAAARNRCARTRRTGGTACVQVEGAARTAIHFGSAATGKIARDRCSVWMGDIGRGRELPFSAGAR